ncbi:FMN-dependent NADH-azoreductase 3 [Pullulanibacillus camelliae]|uniref:FMN dependent NADH:quinone oxidoreductase n=1 Tax=Pullulanibacillus camelliae TaxID=1707096 RepID=A0A8J2YFR3_9BACL|nr:FMN-dependent NADH-azoreductase [Pullulanibacillus camelliae]GGE31055.1 FMN-dependent NADH-azoreductase 3 [Pullulanibacillus camelliae]
MNILVVKANNRPATEAISSKMYETFMEGIQGAEHLNVTTFDVFEEDMPYFGQDLFNAFEKLSNGSALSDVEQRLLAAKQKAKDAVEAADVLVFVFPLWNFTIPAKLQTFIDYIAEAGFTFKYDEVGNVSHPLEDKKVILLNARGGVYSLPETAPTEMAVNYMHTMFGSLFGMNMFDEVIIEGHQAMPDKRDTIIEEGLQKVSELASRIVSQSI